MERRYRLRREVFLAGRRHKARSARGHRAGRIALSPAEKLKVVQKLMEEGDDRAAAIYRSIGVYLAHSLALYHDMYHFRHVLLLGRVMSGRGGELIISECGRVLRDEYSDARGDRSTSPCRMRSSAASASPPPPLPCRRTEDNYPVIRRSRI